LYPIDNAGNNNLGLLYNSIEVFDKAVKHFETAILGDPRIFTPYMNTAFSYLRMAEYDKARSILERYKTLYEDNGRIHNLFFLIYIYEEDFESALKEIEIAINLEPKNFYWLRNKGNLFLITGKWKEAENILKQLLDWEENSAKLQGYESLYDLYTFLGKVKLMKEQAELGLELARQIGGKRWEYNFERKVIFIEEFKGNYKRVIQLSSDFLARIREQDMDWLERASMIDMVRNHLKLGQIKKAQVLSVNLKDQYEKKVLNKKLIRHYYCTEGLILTEQNKHKEAIDTLNRAISMLTNNPGSSWRISFNYALAQVYQKNGDLNKAIEHYMIIINFTISSSISYGNLYAYSLYNLGKIYEEQGKISEAIKFYNKLIELWKDADYDFPELVDAKNRLAVLSNKEFL
jgi:tetratricopeptide (TPR) repeat protein